MIGSPQAVLFDLDGTLLDSAPDFIYSLNLMRHQHQLPPLSHEDIRKNVSNGARALVKLGFNADEGDAHYPALRAELLDIYLASLGKYGDLFDGIRPLLNTLDKQGIAWGIVTNKPRLYSEKLLDILKLTHQCAVLVCPDDIKISKPDPEGLFLAANTLQCDSKQCLYVGDHERDIEAGKRAGMQTVAARYGYIDHPNSVDQWQADFIIDHPYDLIQTVNSLHF